MPTSSSASPTPTRRLTKAERAEIIRRLQQRDPVGFAADVLGFTAWSKQRDIMESVRDHQRTAVRACHGVGKTAGAAQVALWFLATHPNSRVITTAPTWAQVEQLLWREIRAAVGRAHAVDQGHLFPRPASTKLELGDQWFAIGLSTDQPERFQGHHADHILLIVDEASGVDEAIFEAAEGFLTAEGAKVLLIGNPTRIGGQFHRAFTTERARWNQIHVSVYDSPNLTGERVPANVARSLPTAEWVEQAKEAWGADSAMFQVRALGNFADQGPDTLIPLGAVEDAQARDLPANPGVDMIVIGCDVARYGTDETVITTRVGQQVRIAEHFTGKRPAKTTETGPQQGDLVATAGRVAAHALRFPQPAVRIVIDDTGVGGGVTDILRNQGFRVTAFNGSEAAHRPLQFPNRRSELWFEGAAQIDQLDLDQDEQLTADLTAPRYSVDLKARRVVEKKDETKKRLGRSPDRGDAVLLTLVVDTALPVTDTPSRHGHVPGQQFGKWEAAAPTGDSLTEDLLDDPM